ncbi:DUF1232 domain-containing protein [Kineococcus sp. SYSU DK006]|uniref:DUF1232 domain-containing protein n=1 Tax=Kineococcus sp. SYSU DK006 TaxID=3383127 RepID=UPI003D7E7597
MKPAHPSSARRAGALRLVWRTLREGTPPGTPGLAARVGSLPAMTRDSIAGGYRGPGRRRLAWSAVGLAYLLSPLDAAPEALLPLLGLLDDGVVAAWVAGSLLVATEDYAAWRAASRPAVPVAPVAPEVRAAVAPHRRLHSPAQG